MTNVLLMILVVLQIWQVLGSTAPAAAGSDQSAGKMTLVGHSVSDYNPLPVAIVTGAGHSVSSYNPLPVVVTGR